jgi:hypothetical protein
LAVTRKLAIAAAAAIVAISFASGAARAFSFGGIFGNSHGDSFQLIHVRDLARLMDEKDGAVYVYDADPVDVRTQEGIIPGAELLSEYNGYELSELPPDRHARLVFYCHNQH